MTTIVLPFEILQRICELAAEPVDVSSRYGSHHMVEAVDSTSIHFVSLLGFSQASWTCRKIAVPYLFRRLRVKTIEQASMIVKSPVGQYARHVHFPIADSLTCRRPLPRSVSQLVSQSTSICISARDPSFFYTARTSLSSLLHPATNLLSLEFYCEPITYGFDTLSLIGKNLIPSCPKSVKALCIRLPGGQPDYTGPEKLFGALSSSISEENDPLSKLESIHLSVHLSPQIASSPSQLALGIAQCLPVLRHVAIVEPRRNVQRKVSLFELIGPREEPENEESASQQARHWHVLRDSYINDACIDSQVQNRIRLEVLL